MNMKCPACGYEYIENPKDVYSYPVKGDQKFVRLRLGVVCEILDNWDEVQRTETSPVYACPKCGVIKIDPDTVR